MPVPTSTSRDPRARNATHQELFSDDNATDSGPETQELHEDQLDAARKRGFHADIPQQRKELDRQDKNDRLLGPERFRKGQDKRLIGKDDNH